MSGVFYNLIESHSNVDMLHRFRSLFSVFDYLSPKNQSGHIDYDALKISVNSEIKIRYDSFQLTRHIEIIREFEKAIKISSKKSNILFKGLGENHMGENQNYNIKYKFIGKGTVVSKNSDSELAKPKQNRIFLDVGNSLDYANGIIDNHHLDSAKEGMSKEFISIANYCYHKGEKIKNYISKIADNEIDVIVHQEPDLDCIVSAYIITKYINGGMLSKEIKKIIEVVEEIDSGKLTFNNTKPINPCFIVYAIDETIKRYIKKNKVALNKEEIEKNSTDQNVGKNQNNQSNEFNKDELCLERGLKLIDTILTKLESLPGDKRELKNVDLLTDDNFSEELELLDKDYDNYLMDYDDNEVCEKGKIKLPINFNCNNELKEVDALFWHRVPSCILHKYWARQDKRAPLEEGYTFTFIPSDVNVDASIRSKDKDICIEKRQLERIKTNKVIISVDPNKGVDLRGLGEILELAEKVKEKEYFGENLEAWRSRNTSRFPENWCDNEDPWYDGRNFDYTIVDAPRVGSLLSIKEIMHLSKSFSVPQVQDYLVRIVIPFEFDAPNYKYICDSLTEVGNKRCEDAVAKGYFNSYIQAYLFDNPSTKSNEDTCNMFSVEYNVMEYIEAQLKNKHVSSKKKLDFIIFKYGIGFMYWDITFSKYKDNSLCLDEILSVNNKISSIFGENSTAKDSPFNSIIEKMQIQNLEVKNKKTMIFAGVSIKSSLLYEEKHKQILYKMMNFMKWQEEEDNTRYFKCMIGNDIVKSNENTYYGFSKNGAALLIINDNVGCRGKNDCDSYGATDPIFKQKCIYKKNNKAIYKHFGILDFYIFILALQQRLSLLDFSYKLSEYDKERKKKNINKLRSLLLNFTTQGWFVEITEDKIGSEFFKKWTSTFENKDLYEDIYEQLSAVDDYYKARMSNKFTLISAVTFPIVIMGSISSIFSTGYIKSGSKVLDFNWVPATGNVTGSLSMGIGSFGLISLLIAVFLLFIFLKKD